MSFKATPLLARAAYAVLVLGFVFLEVVDGPWSGAFTFAVSFGTGVALVPLLIAAHQAARDEPGLAAIWSAVGLLGALWLELPALHAARMGRLLPEFQCDAMAGDCGPAAWPYWVPSMLFLVSVLLAGTVLVRSFVARWGYPEP